MPRNIRSRASVPSRTSLAAMTVSFFQLVLAAAVPRSTRPTTSDAVMIIGSSPSRNLGSPIIFGGENLISCFRIPRREKIMSQGIEAIILRRPDDWHVHLREGEMLTTILPYTARQFARAIVMPNLVPPVTSVAAAHAYQELILTKLPKGAAFEPLMTCYLTDTT